VEFDVVVPEVEELTKGEPAEVVLANARRKAEAGLGQLGEGEGAVVLAVDTDVALEGRLLGKAGTEDEARERLEALSGRTHEVLSGVVLLGLDALVSDSERKASSAAEVDERAAVAHSYVTFKRLDPATLTRYLRSGEWRDRAGAYAVQGLGSILVARVEGDVSNVIGLPVSLLAELAPELLVARREPPRDRGGRYST
jgi:septum formation protein